MANSISGNGNNSVVINGMTYSLNFATSLTPLGSGSFVESVLINTGSWQPVYTGSQVPDIGTLYARNPGPGTVQISVSGSNTSGSGMLDTLGPSDWGNHSWTGSATLYGRALDSASYVVVGIFPN
jgi:hypothetical protein